MIISKAPCRISFAGGGTDIPNYFERYGGAVVTTSITPSVTITVKDNVMINHSDVPRRSGLGGSSAYIVALLGALYKQFGKKINKYEIANEAVNLERNELGVIGGWQDQFASTFGGFNFIQFDCYDVHITPIPIKKDILRELSRRLILIEIPRNSNKVHKLMEKKLNIEALDKTKELAFDACIALQEGDLNRLGHILDRGWELKKITHPQITNRYIDDFFKDVKTQGAHGKLCGIGGFALILFDEKFETFNMPSLFPFKFDTKGLVVSFK